jgi:hypothetical protein
MGSEQLLCPHVKAKAEKASSAQFRRFVPICERTLLDYIVQPIGENFAGAMRED